jgi:hypothetical protein
MTEPKTAIGPTAILGAEDFSEFRLLTRLWPMYELCVVGSDRPLFTARYLPDFVSALCAEHLHELHNLIRNDYAKRRALSAVPARPL